MRKLILKMSVSVDGFVGGPNGESDWIFKSMDDGSTAWTLDVIWKAGLHMMGSRTFYDMASYWPYSTEVFAAPMNEIPKVVFTRKGLAPVGQRTLSQSTKDASNANKSAKAKPSAAVLNSWLKPQVANGDLAEEINRLKQQPGKDIVAYGGASFARSLVRSGLIDEYHLMTHPTALGAGMPLFSSLDKPLDLKLIDTKAFRLGNVARVYEPASKSQ